jgi:2-dehydropantoate 2-reductase
MPGHFQRIGVVGAGAVGLYFGTKLALAGPEVRFLMRRDLAAVRARGSVRVVGDAGVQEFRPAAAFADPAEVGPVDLAVVALKTTSAADTEGLVGPILGPGTAVLTLQNGLGADEFLAGLFGGARIMGGLVFMAITRTGPGEVTCYHPGQVTIGEFEGGPGARTQELAGLLGAAGIKVRVAENLPEARWTKLVWNIPFNGLSIAEGGVTTDRICADPRLAAETRALMLEVQRAALGFGFRIPDDYLRRQFDVTPSMGAYQPSSLVDYLAGREVEVESIWGEPLRRAAAKGIEMPRLESLYRRLLGRCLGRS